MKSLSNTGNQSVIIVTHNANIALIADRVIHLSDGKIIKNEKNLKPLDIDDIEW